MREVKISCKTIAQGIEAITHQLPAFKNSLHKKVVAVVGHSTLEGLYKDTDQEVIDLVPAMAFGKNNGAIKIVIGAALVVGAFMIDQSGTTSTMIANAMFATGATLVIGGLMELIAPAPKFNTADEQETSKYLGTARNTTAIGTPIPILLGRRDVGGHILSMNVNAREI